MSDKFAALGVEFDLSQATAPDPVIVVGNKPERIEEIEAAIEKHLESNLMSPAEAA